MIIKKILTKCSEIIIKKNCHSEQNRHTIFYQLINITSKINLKIISLYLLLFSY